MQPIKRAAALALSIAMMFGCIAQPALAVDNATLTAKELAALTVEDTAVGDTADTNIASGTHGDALSWVLDENSDAVPITDQDIWNYTDNGDGTATLNGPIDGITLSNNVMIPTEVDGLTVTQIGLGAFVGHTGITGFSVEPENACFLAQDGILFSADGASLLCYPRGKTNTLYQVPDGTSSIASGAFTWNDTLTQITFPEGLTSIEAFAFQNASALEAITFPSSTTLLGDGAFMDCSALTFIRFMGDPPANFAEVAFYQVHATAYYPAGNTSWTADVMQNYGGTLTWEAYTGSVEPTATPTPEPTAEPETADFTFTYFLSESEGTISITGYEGTLPANLTIPATYDGYPVANIWSGFEDADIQTLTIEEGISYLSTAFRGNESLTAAYLPASLIYLATGTAFAGCSNLESIEFAEGSPFIWTADTIQQVTDSGTVLVCWPKAKSLTGTVTLPQATTLSQNVFWACNSIEAIIIPEGYTTVDLNAVNTCASLQSLSLPSTMTSFGGWIHHCPNLTNITIAAGSPYTAENGIVFCDNGTVLVTWPSANGAVTIPNGVQTIADYAFDYITPITSVVLPQSVVTLGMASFNMCTSLSSVSLNEGLQTIGASAFYDCTALTEISIPSTVTSIEYSAFNSCTALSKITFTGDAPRFKSTSFSNVTATAYYPADNATWTEDVMQNYGGTLTWQAYTDSAEPTPEPTAEPTSSTITYDANGGINAPAAQTGGINDTMIVASGFPTRFGYQFLGWSTDPLSTTPEYLPNGNISPRGSVTLYAVWKAAIVLDPAADLQELTAQIDAPCEGVYYAITPTADSVYTITCPNESQLDTFLNVFYADGTLLTSDDDTYGNGGFQAVVSLSANTTYYLCVRFYQQTTKTGSIYFTVEKGNPEPVEVIITYLSNDGNNGAIGEHVVAGEATSITTWTPTNFPCTFLGWAADSNATEPQYYTGGTITPTSDTVLYAVWQQPALPIVTISPDMNSDRLTINLTTPCEGQYFVLTPSEDRTYTFWNANDSYLDTRLNVYDANGTLIAQDDDSYGNGGFSLTLNLTGGETYYLLPHFYDSESTTGSFVMSYSREELVKEYTITYNPRNGIDDMRTDIAYSNAPYEVMEWLPDFFPCTLLGWATTPDATTAEYGCYDSFYPNRDMTLYAVWEQPTLPIVTIDPDAASGEFEVDLSTPCEGQYFRITPSKTRLYTFFSTNNSGDTYGQLFDCYGRELAYSDDDGGNMNFRMSCVLNAGETYYVLGRMFSTGNSGSFTLSMTTLDVMTVTFDGNTADADNLPTVQGAPKGDTLILSNTNPMRDGYRFLGWGTSADATEAAYHPGSSLTITENITLYALWEEADYCFIYHTENGNAVISGYNGTLPAALTIPACYNGLSITAIDDDAFYYCTNLTAVSLPEGLLSIGHSAFRFCPIAEITLPASVSVVENYAFSDSGTLAKATVLNPYANLMIDVFANGSPDGLVLVGYTGSTAEEYLGSYLYTFESLGAIPEDFELPESNVTFSYYTSSFSIFDENGNWLDSIQGAVINGYSGVLSAKLTIPTEIDGYPVMAIGSYSFDNSSSLIQVVIPEGVENIYSYAFQSCPKLTKLSLPSSMKNLVGTSISACPKLVDITIGEGSPYTVVDNAIYKYGTNLVAWPSASGSVVIPAGTLVIDDGAFYDNDYLETVSIPSTLTTIGNNAFRDCCNLRTLTVPEGVVLISDYAFSYCVNLETLSLPGSLTHMDGTALCGCNGLTSLTIASGSTYTAADNVVYNNNGKTLVAAPTATGSFTVPATVTNIGNYAFRDCSALTEVILPVGLTRLGYGAFTSTNLSAISIPDTVSTIEGDCFNGTNISDITLPVALDELDSAISGHSFRTVTVRNPYMSFARYSVQSSPTFCGYTGSTAETFAAEHGYTFQNTLGDIPEIFETIKQYNGISLYSDLGEEPSAVLKQVYTQLYSDGGWHNPTYYALRMEDGQYVVYQRFLNGTDSSQAANLSGTLEVGVYVHNYDPETGNGYSEFQTLASVAGTLVADPVAQTICDALGFTGTSYALRYAFDPAVLPADNNSICLRLQGDTNTNTYSYCTPEYPYSYITPILLEANWDDLPYGFMSTQTTDLNRYEDFSFGLLLPNSVLSSSAAYNLACSFTPDEGYNAEDLTISTSPNSSVYYSYTNGPGWYNQYNNWSVTVTPYADVAGTLTVTLTPTGDVTAVDGMALTETYTADLRIESIRQEVEAFTSMVTSCDNLMTATDIRLANNLTESGMLYLRSPNGLTEAQQNPDNWTVTDTSGSVTGTFTVISDTCTPGTDRTASALQLVLNASAVPDGSSGTIRIENTAAGICLEVSYTLFKALEEIPFNETIYDGHAFSEQRIYATIGADGHYWTADTATRGNAATTGMVATFGGFGDLNMKLGEVLHIGTRIAQGLAGTIYNMGSSLFRVLCNAPTWMINAEYYNIPSNYPSYLGYYMIHAAHVTSVTGDATVSGVWTSGEAGQYATLTANQLGTGTVTYAVADPNLLQNVVETQQTVTVVGDLESISIDHLANTTLYGSNIIQLDHTDGALRLDAPVFNWADGVEGIDDYKYYLCGNESVATIEYRSGVPYLVPTGMGSITLLVESTATRSNLPGANWERLYADEFGYALHDTIQVLVTIDDVYDVTGGALAGNTALYRVGSDSLLGGTLCTVDGSTANPEGWRVEWGMNYNTDSYTFTQVDDLTVRLSGPAYSGFNAAMAHMNIYYHDTLVRSSNYIVQGRLSGDCYNGGDFDVSAPDLLAAANKIAGKASRLSPADVWVADVDQSGTLDVLDLARIAKYVTGELDPRNS